MRDGCFSSIISQLHKSETISILVLSAMASMLFVPVSAYEEIVSFDGDSSVNLTNCSRIVWYIDSSIGHVSPPSLHSGPIRSGGASCVEKWIEGPASINFWWKADQYSPKVGMLLFTVDYETILQCTSSDWSPVDYAVPSGSHRLSWEYRKLRSYPEYAGAGWIDDLKIVYPQKRPSGLEVLPENVTCCDQLPSIRGDIERVNKGLSGLETRVGQIDVDIRELSSNQTTLQELVGRLNLSGLDERLRQLDINNLSWISENVVYVSSKNANLTDVINKNRYKTILLADGVYHTGGLNITISDIYIRSLRKWGAVLDADCASSGVILDTVKNVTLESVVVTNCSRGLPSRGLHIENCTNCNIINNLIVNFNETGILSRNNSQCTFMLNRLESPGTNISGFDMSRANNNNTYLFNEINISKYDNTSFYYSITSPAKDNYITVSDDGFIKEDDIYCYVWDNKFICNWSNRTIADLAIQSNNTWNFLNRTECESCDLNSIHRE